MVLILLWSIFVLLFLTLLVAATSSPAREGMLDIRANKFVTPLIRINIGYFLFCVGISYFTVFASFAEVVEVTIAAGTAVFLADFLLPKTAAFLHAR